MGQPNAKFWTVFSIGAAVAVVVCLLGAVSVHAAGVSAIELQNINGEEVLGRLLQMTIWERAATRLRSSDAYTFVLLLILFPLARMFFEEDIYVPLAKILIPENDGGEKLRKKKFAKFIESAWKFTCFSGLAIFGLYVSYDMPWFTDTRQFWNGWPFQAITPKLKLYYFAQMAQYMYAQILLYMEPAKSDWVIMNIHHVATMGLIAYSYAENFLRVGSIIMLLHDTCDVFLESAKLCNYSKTMYAQNVLFGCFVLCWVVLRLFYFPFFILKSTVFEVIEYLNIGPPYPPAYYIFNVLLMLILALNIYWFYLIARMVYKLLTDEITKDIRSDDED